MIPQYHIQVQLPDGEWELQEAYYNANVAADMLLVARDDGFNARVIDGRGDDVTAQIEAIIREWIDARGQEHPKWMSK